MTWRCQPPVFSPVTPRSVAAGISGFFQRGQGPSERSSRELQERFGAADALLTDSGTSALVLVLRHFVPSGGTVAYPGYGCIDLTAAAIRAGVRVRLYDLDPTTLSPDLDSVRRVINRGVDAIVVAHLFGYPAEVASVQGLAAQHGIPVIEDAAQAAGGTFLGEPLGTLADVSILSFGRGKGITAGSGGAVLVRTKALAEWTHVARSVLPVGRSGAREVGIMGAQWLFARPSLYRIPTLFPALKLGQMVYRPAREPRAISTTASAMLPTCLGLAESAAAHRRARAAEILSRIGDTGRLLPVRPLPGANPGYLRLALLDNEGDAWANEDLGVLRGYPMTLEQHEQLRPILEAREKAGKGSEVLRDRLITVPTHSRMGDADVARVREWLSGDRLASSTEVWAT